MIDAAPSTRDPRLGAVGRPEAADLVRQMLDGSAPVRAGVLGPGGAGKSTLLDEVAAALRAGGMEVARGADDLARTEGDPERAVVLVDDAEHLDDEGAAAIAALIRPDGPHLVVAFRPWPRSAAVAGLVDRLQRDRPLLVLQPLTSAGAIDRAVELLGDQPTEDRVARLLEVTGGNPRLVDTALLGMRDGGWDLEDRQPLPPTTLERLRHGLDRMDPALVDLLVALAVGYSASGPALATAPRFGDADLRELMAAARGSGLVAADGTPVPIVRQAILQSTPAHELWAMRRELVDAVEAAGLPLGAIALDLAHHGFQDPRVARALEEAADEALATDPIGAWRGYAASIQAGADAATLAGRRAQAAWAVGDIRSAERLIDGLLAGTRPPDLPRAMNVAAAIWARKGMLRRAADAYVGLAEAHAAGAAPLAAVCCAALGEPGQARAVLAIPEAAEFPTSSLVAASLMADGIVLALDGPPDRALSALLQSSSIMSESGDAVPLPEAPAVLAAHVALDAGEVGIADDVLRAAVDAGQGGPAFRDRLRLTQALVALRADDAAQARAHLDATASSRRPLGPRDELLAHAVRVGLARRTDDLAALVRAWDEARTTVARVAVDLTALPALGELAIASARLDEAHVIEKPLAAAWDLLARAGEPAGWSTDLHWAGVQAAILRHDDAELARHSTALLEAGASNRVASRLAEAGRIWAAALRGEVDVEAVEAAAHELAGAGYLWEAGRLAGHAAGRASEHGDTLRLLALARGLHADAPRRDASEEPAARDDGRDDGVLSPREREVAQLVLEGKTYAEIGRAIFISPRTVEHHIARIRRRLAVSTRSELLARLRHVLDENG